MTRAPRSTAKKETAPAPVAKAPATKAPAAKAPVRRPRAQAVPIAGRVPSIDPAQAQALRDLFAQPLSWSTRDGSWLRLRAAPAPAGASALFELESQGERMHAGFDPSPVTADVLHWSDYAGRARTLAWALAHEGAIVRLGEALGVSLLPLGAVGDAPPAGDGLWLRFTEHDDVGGAGACRGHLRLPLAWLPRLLELAERDTPDAGAHDWNAWPAQATVAIEGRPMRHADWQRLRRGDVLVLGGRTQPLRAHARAQGRRWPLQAVDGGWSVTGAATEDPQHEDATMQSDEMEAAPSGAEATDDGPARDLPVQLSFDLGTVTLTLGAVAALQPGYVFALPARLEGTNVTVRANGRVAGRGEVVAIGDTLGVRLVSWD